MSSPVPAFMAAYAAYVATVHAVPGPWRQWKDKGPAAFDMWTLTHVAWGAVAKLMGISLEELVVLASINEVGEYVVREARPDLLWGSPETPDNVAADLVSTVIGWALVNAIKKK